MDYTNRTTSTRNGAQASPAAQADTELRLGMNPFHDVRGSSSMSVNQPMQYYEVHTGIPDLVDAHGRNWSTLESLYHVQPVLPPPRPIPPIAYITEIEELYHTEWIVEREPFDLVYTDDIIQVPGNGFVADPMTGRPVLLSQYDRMYQPYVLPHPSHHAAQRFQLITEVNFTLGNAFVNGTLRPEDFRAIQSSILHQVPEETAGIDNLRINVENMTYEQLVELQEHIGAVDAGLREETILAHVTRRNFQSLKNELPADSEEWESCCICQEEYAHGDDLAKLQCRHEFHYNCIKRWLFQKNQCPLCKSTAIRV